MERLSQEDIKLATAESCTGGILASLFTDVSGRSHVFEAGFVSYSDDAKTRMLGVPAELIARHGAVSKETAAAMVEGALRGSNADLAISVTGFAGPGEDGEEAGLVHFACAWREGVTLHAERHFGTEDRGETRLCCIDTALDLLSAALGQSEPEQALVEPSAQDPV
jgi:nicotinamide-nucleotide amidase